MTALRCAFTLLAAPAMMLAPAAALAQEYPDPNSNRPIRIVAGQPGGNADFHARLLASGFTSAFGKPVVVDNRAGTTVNRQIMVTSAPDGYTLLVQGSNFWVAPLLQGIPYEALLHDFAPISSMSNSPQVLVIHPSFPVKSVKELIAVAKASPGKLSYAAGTLGGAQHIAGELFKSMTGITLAAIPYKGEGTAIRDVYGGQIPIMFPSAQAAIPYLKTGKLIALAVTSAKPSAVFPGLPVVAATVPGYESGSKQGLFAPNGTPPHIVNRLNQEVARLLRNAEIKERLLGMGIETAPGLPDQFAAQIRTEIGQTRKLLVGLKIE